MNKASSNIILIGMAGAGKSTVGKFVAQKSRKQLIDCDDLIAGMANMGLQDYLNRFGKEKFLSMEEKALLSIQDNNLVISTGGSAIYSDKGMKHLKKTGPVVLLDVNLETSLARISDMDKRGIIKEPGQSFEQLFASRQPLYKKWADITISAQDKSPAEIAEEILVACS